MSQQIGGYLISKILLSLSYVHSIGLSHRDIKLENILIDSQTL